MNIKEIKELTENKPRKHSHKQDSIADPLLMQRKSSVRTGPKMSPEERKLMSDVIYEEAKLVEEETGIMIKESKKAGKVLCGLSCENSFFLIVGLFTAVVVGTFFPLFGIVLADAITGLNNLSYYTSQNNSAEADKAGDTVNEMALYFLILSLSFGILQFAETAAFG